MSFIHTVFLALALEILVLTLAIVDAQNLPRLFVESLLYYSNISMIIFLEALINLYLGSIVFTICLLIATILYISFYIVKYILFLLYSIFMIFVFLSTYVLTKLLLVAIALSSFLHSFDEYVDNFVDRFGLSNIFTFTSYVVLILMNFIMSLSYYVVFFVLVSTIFVLLKQIKIFGYISQSVNLYNEYIATLYNIKTRMMNYGFVGINTIIVNMEVEKING
jgi:hypothetical protein